MHKLMLQEKWNDKEKRSFMKNIIEKFEKRVHLITLLQDYGMTEL